MKHAVKAVLAVGLGCLMAQAAQAEESVRLVLDWAFEGPQAMWSAAQKSGCFGQKGLNVTIDRGFGSGDSISKVASGSYAIGVADFGSVLAYNAQHPDAPLIITFIVSDRSSASVNMLKSSGITKPLDLQGKRIADTQGEASRMLFPAFAKANGIDMSTVSWVTVAPNLRQATVVRGQADAAAGHLLTVVNGFVSVGVKRDQIVSMPFAEYGVDVPGNAVVVKPQWAQSHPQQMRDFLSCTVVGIKATIADPQAAIASLRSYNSMLDATLEAQHLDFATHVAVLTPHVKQNGLSNIDPARLNSAIAQIADAMGFVAPPSSSVWTADYLPAQSELAVSNP
ncbi:ABC transporter substrate-binding protein [Pseudomonas typographi]|uniref:Thiamine pyrimidine synthase n=1 Tax=Pseudomonas typographi TaxID=2715964 RepID=A0ABR7Z3N3_9PSED|nr:ABC transporter substrate-binding protein [Pseudomonas typographi]MBD1552030.1 ABC transporter substrate-binding protein [Pseudomonas typographi]MBD1600094.1 ABC transporter substrate-binding protein [Pseudomonas typographi]